MAVERRGAAIEIAGLCKEYQSARGHVLALDGIDLTIAPGEFVCIVGPSGCGKSTLLRILAGLDRQSSGTLTIAAPGWPVENAMVFQESGLFPWMSVESNVGFGLMTRGVPRAEAAERVEAALKLVGLTKFRRHYPHQLSGGMRQRSAIARAFVTDPGVLLMDEPFAALDAQNRAILQAELVRIWEQTRKTVVYITHSIEEALMLGDRTVVMTAQPGRIKEIVDVPFPHPRELLTLSASAEFGKLKLDIWRVLEDEVNRARAEDRRMMGLSAKTRERLLYLISPIGLLLLWQLLLMAGIGDRRFIPAPSDIALSFWKLAVSGELWLHVGVTLYRVFLGFIIGSIPAVAMGLLMAMFKPVRIFFDPLIATLFPIPKIALMPLLLLAFGFGDASKVALVAIAVFFPVIVNTYVGASNIDKIYWDVAKNYGASQWIMFTRVVFFGALPTIFAGLRIALAVSFIVLVASEFVATKSGIGYLIWNSWELLQVDVMFVGIVTIGILGLITSVIFQEVERKAVPWKAE